MLLLLLACTADKVDDSAPEGPTWSTLAEALPGALLSLAQTPSGDVWAVGGDVGEGPMILHYDGSAWSWLDAPSGGDLWWVYATDEQVVTVGAGGRVLTWDGAAWGEEVLDEGITLFGVWGAEGQLWTVGGDTEVASDGARMWHHDGAAWSEVTLPEAVAAQVAVYKLWGRSASELYAVGTGGVILSSDGEAWTQLSSPTDRNLFTISGDSQELLAVGGAFSGTLLRSEGGEWVDETPDLSLQLNGVSARDGCDPVAGGMGGQVYRREGGAWVADPRGTATALDLHAVLIDADCEVWGVGGSISSSPLTSGLLVSSRDDVPEVPSP